MASMLVILSILAIYLLIGWLMMKQNDRRLLAKQNTRTLLTREAFIRFYVEHGYKEVILQDLYNEVKSYVPKDFNLDPSDDLMDVYKIDESDLEDLAIKYFKSEKNRPPNSIDFEKFNLKEKPLRIFESLLAFAHQ